MKEKTVVCVGILLILAVLTSCAFFYSVNGYSTNTAHQGDVSAPQILPIHAGPYPAEGGMAESVFYTGTALSTLTGN